MSCTTRFNRKYTLVSHFCEIVVDRNGMLFGFQLLCPAAQGWDCSECYIGCETLICKRHCAYLVDCEPKTSDMGDQHLREFVYITNDSDAACQVKVVIGRPGQGRAGQGRRE